MITRTVIDQPKETPHLPTKYSPTAKLLICGIVSVLITHILFFVASYLIVYSTRHIAYDQTPELFNRIPLSYKNVSFLSPHGIEDKHVNIVGWFFEHAKNPESIKSHCEEHNHLCNIYNKTNNDATVVVVHGHGVNMGRTVGNNKSVLNKAVLPFHLAGFNVLAIDLRNHGLSGDALPVSLGMYEYLDVLAAVEWLRQQHNESRSSSYKFSTVPNLEGVPLGSLKVNPQKLEIIENIEKLDLSYLDPSRIVLWGESMGGSTVYHAASHDKNSHVKAIVCDSSFASARETFGSWVKVNIGRPFNVTSVNVPQVLLDYLWSCVVSVYPYELTDIRPVEEVKNIKVPIFIAHGRTDSIVPFSHSAQLIAAAENRKDCRNCEVRTAFHDGDHVYSYTMPGLVLDMISFVEAYI